MDAQLCPEARAKDLLRRILPEGQWEQFSETGTLEIPGSRGTLLDVSRCCAHASRRIAFAISRAYLTHKRDGRVPAHACSLRFLHLSTIGSSRSIC